MSFLSTLLAGITPPPVVTPEEYDGWEYRWKFFVFRPATLKTEGYLALGFLVYVLFTFYGIARNSSKAKNWLNAHLPIYERQFSKPQSKGGLISDGYSDYFNFSTGRRNIASLHSVLTLRPRHDLFQILYQTLWTLIDLHYNPEDEVQLDFKLAPGALPHDFVWAVVAKNDLLSVKKDRWDLTFTKTTDNPALPPTLSVMSEFADVTESILRPVGSFSIIEVLKDPKIQPYFRSLSVTDQPRTRPSVPVPAENREKHVILNLRLPSNSADTASLVSSVFQFVDNLTKLNLRPETKTKLKKAREETDKLIKEEEEKEAREEQLDQKAAEKRKAREERMAKLSAADQKKELDRERKRNMRKAQGKVAIRK
ncbi:hypothetical protein EST38_g607 [Candolleomyces aberdarensis]|uniref:DUF1682-domain-containing protein n=1 Tax=Candolleomyces aberdarensis TaxID=2316362 RepID=A0A4Q2DXL8_9AGAR|nr:hypothetical protein EST38_g607 [Candolleomyces aberdarensis]